MLLPIYGNTTEAKAHRFSSKNNIPANLEQRLSLPRLNSHFARKSVATLVWLAVPTSSGASEKYVSGCKPLSRAGVGTWSAGIEPFPPPHSLTWCAHVFSRLVVRFVVIVCLAFQQHHGKLLWKLVLSVREAASLLVLKRWCMCIFCCGRGCIKSECTMCGSIHKSSDE